MILAETTPIFDRGISMRVIPTYDISYKPYVDYVAEHMVIRNIATLDHRYAVSGLAKRIWHYRQSNQPTDVGDVLVLGCGYNPHLEIDTSTERWHPGL